MYSDLESHDRGVVLVNGSVYTPMGWREVVAFRGGRITFVGDNRDVDALGSDYRVVDIGKGVVLPAFVDTHMHPAMSGIDYLFNVILHDAYSLDEYLKLIERFAKKHPELPVIMGSGFQRSLFDELGPRRELLDRVEPNRPVAITSADGHSVWVNSKALLMAGITKDTKDPEGGIINRDPKTGEPSGLLLEKSAMELVNKILPKPDINKYKEALLFLNKKFNSVGLTTCHDAIVPLDNPNYYNAYEELARENKLTVRYRGSWFLDPDRDYREQIERGVELSKEFKTPYWQVNSFKFFADYVIEEQTGYLWERYINRDDEWYGIKVWEDKKLKDALKLIDSYGFQVHIHQIGDAAASYFLDALEWLEGVNGKRERRNSFAHVQLLKDSDKKRMARLGIIAHTAPYWAVVDDYYEELSLPYLGAERANNMYPMKSLIDAGVKITIHSDFSVSEPNLMTAFYNGVTRRLTVEDYNKMRAKMKKRASLPPDTERINIGDLIKAATINGAFANYLEGEIGSVEVGKRADLVVLSKNPFTVDVEELPYIEIYSTYFEGREVFRNF